MNRFVFSRGVFLIGSLLLIGASISCNLLIFRSMASTTHEVIIFLIFGLVYDSFKVTFAVVIKDLYAAQSYVIAFFMLISWLLLTAVSMITGFVFLTNMTEKTVMESVEQSPRYQRLEASLITTETQINSLSLFSLGSDEKTRKELVSLEERLEEYRSQPAIDSAGRSNPQVGNVGRRTGECIGKWGHYYNSYCPGLKRFWKDIAAKKQILDTYNAKHKEYLSALATRGRIQTELDKLPNNTNVGGTVHLIFNTVAKLFGWTKATAKTSVLFSLSTFSEILATIAILGFIVLGPLTAPVQAFPTVGSVTNPTVENVAKLLPRSPVSLKKTSPTRATQQLKMETNVSDELLDKLFQQATVDLTAIESKKGIKMPKLVPSLYGLNNWTVLQGVVLTRDQKENFQMQWLDLGLIEPTESNNGSKTYRTIGLEI